MSALDRLRANAPPLETRHDAGGHAMLGGTEGDQAYVFTPVQAAEPAGRVTASERHDRAAGVEQRLRCGKDVPRKDTRADVRVHCLESWAIAQDQVQPCSGVTDVRVSTRHG